MTEKTAQTVANVALGVAAVGAAYVILKTPPLRRWAVGLAVTALTGVDNGGDTDVGAWLSPPPWSSPIEGKGRAMAL